ncbi:MAG: hypothetical protein IPJ90_22295 [Anaerolineaceae bacterium]|nr:hypothetical protein [Anaerolineaceae bacterium]
MPQADTSRIGMWGHSMGGGITTKVLTVTGGVKAAVLHAPNSANDADLIARWGPGCLPDPIEIVACNPGEVIPASLPDELLNAYLAAASSPEMLQQIAPIYHLDAVSAPCKFTLVWAMGPKPSKPRPIGHRRSMPRCKLRAKTAPCLLIQTRAIFLTARTGI